MTRSTAAVPGSAGATTIETRASWAVCLTALGIAAVSFAAPAITVVGLKSIAADLGGERSVPALAYSLAWLGASVGGIAMGHAAERFGVRADGDFRFADDRRGAGAGAERRRASVCSSATGCLSGSSATPR